MSHLKIKGKSGQFVADKSLASTGNRTPDRPGRGLVAIPSTLSRIPDVTNYNENCWRQDESQIYINAPDQLYFAT